MDKTRIKIILMAIYILFFPCYIHANSESDYSVYALNRSIEQTKEERKAKRQERKAERKAKREAKKETKEQGLREQEVKNEVEIHNVKNEASEITVPSSQRVTGSANPITGLNKSVNRNKDVGVVSRSSKMTSDAPRQSNSTQNQEKPILWVLLDSKAFWICLIMLFISLSIVMSGFRKRCRNCGKWWAMKIIGKKLVDEKASWIKKEFKDKTRDGRIIRTREEAVPATVSTYRIDRRCKHCGHEDYLIKEEKREN